MLKTDVLSYFGSAAKVAELFGISEAAVSQWGEVIPEARAYQARDLSNGELSFDPAVYAAKRKERAA